MGLRLGQGVELEDAVAEPTVMADDNEHALEVVEVFLKYG